MLSYHKSFCTHFLTSRSCLDIFDVDVADVVPEFPRTRKGFFHWAVMLAYSFVVEFSAISYYDNTRIFGLMEYVPDGIECR